MMGTAEYAASRAKANANQFLKAAVMLNKDVPECCVPRLR